MAGPTDNGDGQHDDEVAAEPQERLSFLRLGILLGIVALVAAGIVVGVRRSSRAEAPERASWSIPYVDVTLTPTYEFQNPQANPARDVALSFVVADPDEPCTPSWGGYYSLDAAGETLDIDRRISQLRAAGGDVMVSLGGAANHELAVACQDDAALLDAYRAVVERYDLRAVDLDIEGADLADQPSMARRAKAIAALQAERSKAGDDLAVWLTLPVATTGLTAAGLDVVGATLAGGVKLTGVNVMAMDFGDAAHPTGDMLAATESAMTSAVGQVADAYGAHGVTLDETERWSRLGVTVMIGQNDVDGEVFTLGNAQGLAVFAMAKGVGRVSFWSLNRDAPCDATFSGVRVHSNTCSGVEQEPLAFSNAFGELTGRAPYLPNADAITVPDRTQAVDDPASSPYPVWRPDASYPEGYKVVRAGKVFQAKWYTQGDDPSAVVANPWDSPWTLVGPVSPDDAPFTPTTVASGTYPAWSHDQLYAQGDRVLFEGLPYEARWPNQAEAPSTLFPVGPDSAWKPLFDIAGEPTSQ